MVPERQSAGNPATPDFRFRKPQSMLAFRIELVGFAAFSAVFILSRMEGLLEPRSTHFNAGTVTQI
jgi:hypothetical protein